MLKMDITFEVILDIYTKKFSRCDSLNIGYGRKKRLGSDSRIIENNFFSFVST